MAVTPEVVGSVSAAFADGQVKVRGDLAVVATPSAVTVVSVADPSAPVVLGSWAVPSPYQLMPGFALDGDHAVLPAWNTGTVTNAGRLYVLDISDPAAPTLAGEVSTTGDLRRGVMVGSYYVAPNGGVDDLVVVDVSDRATPRQVAAHSLGTLGLENMSGIGHWSGSRYVLFTELTSGSDVAVIDLPDPATAPTKVGGVSDALFDDDIRVMAALDARYALAMIYRRLIVVDLANLAAPKVAGSLFDSMFGTPTGVVVIGDHAVVSGSSYLVVVDLSSPTNPTRAGYLNIGSGGAADVAVYGKYAVVPGSTGLTVLDPGLNDPPTAPTLVFPATGAGIDRTSRQRFSWRPNDPDMGDTQSAYRLRHRPVGVTAWTDTGWVVSASSWRDIEAGTFTEGDHEWQVATKDSYGIEGPFSPSGFFTATTPPPGPTITAPVNGAVISTSSSDVVWSTPDQDAYQLQVLDEAEAVVSDTGTVNNPSARSRTVEFPDNDTTRTIQLRVLFEGLWSPWSQVAVTVSYTAPAVPSVALLTDDRSGSITVTPGIPAPAEGEPAVVAFDVWVREVGDTGDGKRLASGRAPSQDYTWWTPASGTDYEFRIQARGDNDTTTWSAWAGGPARYDESTYDAAAYA